MHANETVNFKMRIQSTKSVRLNTKTRKMRSKIILDKIIRKLISDGIIRKQLDYSLPISFE